MAWKKNGNDMTFSGDEAWAQKTEKLSDEVFWNVAEGVGVVVLLTGALVLRLLVLAMPEKFPVLYGLAATGENSEYFLAAKVTEGGSVPQIAHGAVYFYLRALHLLFFLLGNKWEAGIWLQIGLQLLGAVLIYLGTRKMAGFFPAAFSLLYLLFLPGNIEAGLVYSPDMLYLCFWGLGLILAVFCCGTQTYDGAGKWREILSSLAAGVFAALVCYLDVSGISLVFLCLAMLLPKRGTASAPSFRKMGLKAGLLLFSFIGSFAGFLALDAWSSRISFVRVWNAWFALYRPKGWDPSFWSLGFPIPGYVGILILVLAGAVAFWCEKNGGGGIPWLLTLLVLCILGFMHFPTDRMGVWRLTQLAVVVLAGIGLRDVLERRKAPQPSPNPLPEPKRKKKKVVDYALEPEESQMHYDIEVADDDDYDY